MRQMLKRKIMKDLINWKNNPDKMCLLIKGARQVGKTYIIDKFCKENYKNYIYINFFEGNNYKEIFEGNLDIDTICKQLSLKFPNISLSDKPNETVLVLDEIQDCPQAITALKFLSIAKRFDVIATGSLLGINYKEVPSYPVGYIEHLEMHSLDFEEFCWANGISEEAFGYIREYYEKLEPVPALMHNQMMELFKEHIVVGGMPRVVDDFVKNHNFASVLKLQRGILQDYENDIIKYGDNTEKPKIRNAFLSIPKHLAKDYKKFRYNLIESGANSRKYASSLRWLDDANITCFCYNLSTPELPLEGNAKNDIFKIYMRDTGLLMAMLEDGYQEEIISGNLGIYKGAIYENIIADIFVKKNRKLYYFEHNSTLEIDFIIKYKNKATGVEVKSSNNTKSKSLNTLINNWNLEGGIKLSNKNVSIISDKVINLPLYMAIFL